MTAPQRTISGSHVIVPQVAYQIERFLAGEDVLFPIEASEIGDVSGLRTRHRLLVERAQPRPRPRRRQGTNVRFSRGRRKVG